MLIIPNPIDLEIICGQVLRNTLAELVLKDLKNLHLLKELEDDQAISPKALAILANAMGANLQVETKEGVVSETFEGNGAFWKVRLVKEGDHYNFHYPKVADNIDHNKNRNAKMHLGEILKNEALAKADKTGDVRKQMDDFIKEGVKLSITDLITLNAARKQGL